MKWVVLALVLAQCLTTTALVWYKVETDEVIGGMYSAIVRMLEWQEDREATPWFEHRNEETDI